MIINEAFYTVMEGTATREDIDTGMKLGTNYPMGPFEWAVSWGITNIYEGTTQLQVVAAIGSVIGGVIFERLNEYESDNDFDQVSDLYEIAQGVRAQLEMAVSHIKQKGDSTVREYHSERLVNMAIDTILSYLLCIDALKSDRKKKVARIFITKAKHQSKATMDYILSDDNSLVEMHEDIIYNQEAV